MGLIEPPMIGFVPRDGVFSPRIGRISPRMFLIGMQLLELTTLLAAAGMVCDRSGEPLSTPLQRASVLAVLSAVMLTFGILKLCGAYRSVVLSWPAQARCATIAFVVGAAALWWLLRFLLQDDFSRIWTGWLFGSLVALCLVRSVAIPLAGRLQAEGILARRVAMFGLSEVAQGFIRSLRRNTMSGVELVGVYGDCVHESAAADEMLPLRGGLSALIRDARQGAFDAVVVDAPLTEPLELARVCRQMEGCAIDVFRPYEPVGGAELPIGHLGGIPVVVVARRPLSEWQVLQKAAFDRAGAAILLVLLLPAFVVIAALIRWDSPGPILFRQPRIGFNNNPFVCFKFRTMYNEARDLLADRQTTRDDHRVTRIGRWLRRASLDELPQLLNVLRGEMSLVGPRPHAPNTRAGGRVFADVVPGYARRHRIKPGITGWAQINGWRGETITAYQLEQRVEHDLFYIENWSFRFDLYILLLTAARGFVGPQAF